MMLNDSKYVVFKRTEFFEMLGELALPPWRDHDGELIGVKVDAASVSEKILNRVEATEIADAVVIRRQDLFASPCLLAYSIMISMVASHHGDDKVRVELQAIADYFHEQGVLAGDEGWKLPDL